MTEPFQAESRYKNEQIRQAITKRCRLGLEYQGRSRIVVEPYLLGRLPNGQDALLCWQIVPPVRYGKNWLLLGLGSIDALEVLDRPTESFR